MVHPVDAYNFLNSVKRQPWKNAKLQSEINDVAFSAIVLKDEHTFKYTLWGLTLTEEMNPMKNIMILIVCFTFIIQGCSTLNSSTQQIKIACTPCDGVTLTVNSQKQPQCPIQMDVPRDRKLTIEAVKDDYLPYSKTIDYHLNNTGTLDAVGIVFTFFSVFGLLSAGAWDLNETSIDVVLSKK